MESKRRKIGMVLVFAVLFTTLAFVSIGCASADTIYVPDNFTTIQWAVNNATSGDTIIVRDGTYTENVDVDVTHLTIRSANGTKNCIVNALDSGDHVFEVSANYVNISGLTATGAGNYKAGIYLGSGVEHCNISSNTANSNNDYGIYLYHSSNNSITDNTASNNGFGIYLYHSSNNSITDNTASNNHYGIELSSSSNNTLTNNTANSNYYYGIELSSSSNNSITDNTASNNDCGILLFFSSNNTLTNNTASNNDCGIGLSSSSNNTLTNNTANSNNEYGIYLHSSSNNTLTNNTASNNSQEGIYLYLSSNYNTLTNNTANSNNDYGICLESSNNNLIYNNYFNNTNNAWDNGNNIWNITKTAGTNIIGGQYLGGNYWSDYTGEDLDGDGLGDTLLPYNSSGNIVNGGDCLPLLLPYTHTDVGVTVDIELPNPSEIEPLLPLGTDLSNAIIINVNVIDDTPEDPVDDAYTDITINVGALDVETCDVYKEGSGFLPEVDDVATLPTVKPPGEAKFSRDVANNTVIIRLYVGDPLLGVIPPSIENVFDSHEGTYPSIMGTHKGEIKPSDDINVSKLYTYPCVGTGGHTESIKLYENDILIASGTWNGYQDDWHNITITTSVILQAGHTYNYTIVTGSYPQIIHAKSKDVTGGTITCNEFVDANGKTYTDWIPAIRLI
jgi:parallel beta-helix repeat protein